jgi:S1-C subfamily serine protease
VTPRGALDAEEQNNIAVFKNVSPSVVNITALGLERDFLSLNVQQVPQGTGTGFVWDAQGHIVTNFHVIQDANAARVTLADQSSYKAELVGFPDRDLAVLRIQAPEAKLKAVPLGTSRDLLVGQKVYAIGNPFGLDQSLTTGIISALGREIESVTAADQGRHPDRCRHQPRQLRRPAARFGGPAHRREHRHLQPLGASAGIGFAIPVDEVNRIVPRLIRDGRMVRPALGVSTAPPEWNRALGLPKGVAIVRVQRQGPAAQAGFKPFSRAKAGWCRAMSSPPSTASRWPRWTTCSPPWKSCSRAMCCTVTLWRAGQTRQQRVTLAASED